MVTTVGQRVRTIRRLRGLNRQQVADAAGVHMTTVRTLERCTQADTSLYTLAGLARALNVPIGVLLGELPIPTGEPVPWARVRAEVEQIMEVA